MAAPTGQYKVTVNYNLAQCEMSYDKTPTMSDSDTVLYFNTTTTFTFTPKAGYIISNIAINDYFGCSYEIIGGNQIKITADPSCAGSIYITVTTAEDIKDLSTLFTKIANAIRAKSGKTGQIKAINFPSEIAAIQSGGIVPATVTIAGSQNALAGIAAYAAAPGGILDYMHYNRNTQSYSTSSKSFNSSSAISIDTVVGAPIFISSSKSLTPVSNAIIVSNIASQINSYYHAFIATDKTAAVILDSD